MIEHRHLRAALAVAKHGRFRRAAASLGVSQPTLTRRIAALENEVGVKVFDRLPSGVSPTVCGAVVLRWASRVIADLIMLQREVDGVRGLRGGELRIAVGPYPAELSAHPAAAQLLDAHPSVRVRLRQCDWREVIHLVSERKVDMGVGEPPDAGAATPLEFESLAIHPLAFYCRVGHPLLSAGRPKLSDLIRFPWVTTTAAPRLADALPQAGAAGVVDSETGDFRPAMQVDDVPAARSIVKASNALGAAVLTQLEEEIVQGRLVAIDFEAEWFHLSYGILSLPGVSPAPVAAELIRLIREREQAVTARERALRKRYLA